MPDSLRPHGLQPTRLHCLWDIPGKDTGVGCHFLLQGIFPTQGSNPGLLHFRQILYQLATRKAQKRKALGFNWSTSLLYPEKHTSWEPMEGNLSSSWSWSVWIQGTMGVIKIEDLDCKKKKKKCDARRHSRKGLIKLLSWNKVIWVKTDGDCRLPNTASKESPREGMGQAQEQGNREIHQVWKFFPSKNFVCGCCHMEPRARRGEDCWFLKELHSWKDHNSGFKNSFGWDLRQSFGPKLLKNNQAS